VKADEEGKLKVDLTLKTIYELKKDLDALRNHLRNITYEFKQIEEEADRLKAIINSKLIEI
jgi:chaperonin cofactor prefoldin